MTFRPNAGDSLNIDGAVYRIAEHPAAPHMAYGQEGRAGIVYQVQAADGAFSALKTFKPRHRIPTLVRLADQLEEFADLPGMQVCRRTVLTPQKHTSLLQQEPDLTYAVLMPWIAGPTWMQVMFEGRILTSDESLGLARALSEILAELEQHGVAHCDLSAPNVLLPGMAGARDLAEARDAEVIALVDVEQLYESGLRRPQLVPGGSPGYAHKTAPDGLWGPNADRFAGAVLLAEMLAWSDENARTAAWGENYFAPDEMQTDCERYRKLTQVLRNGWGAETARLFERAWTSKTLADCATFGEWLVTIPEEVIQQSASNLSPVPPERAAEGGNVVLEALLGLAHYLQSAGDVQGAVAAYRRAMALPDVGVGTSEELAMLVNDLLQRDHQPLGSPGAAGQPSERAQQIGGLDAAKAEVPEQRNALERDAPLSGVVSPTSEHDIQVDPVSAESVLEAAAELTSGHRRRTLLTALLGGGGVLIFGALIVLAALSGGGPFGALFPTPPARSITETDTPALVPVISTQPSTGLPTAIHSHADAAIPELASYTATAAPTATETLQQQISPTVTPTVETTAIPTLAVTRSPDPGPSRTVAPTPVPNPVIRSFAANPSVINQGQSSTLSWNVENAQTVTLDTTAVSAQGSTSVSPSSTTTYQLKAVGQNGTTVNGSVTVTVVVAVPDPVIQSFSANPSSITQGQSSTLSWDVKNAQTVTLGSNPVSAQGSTSVSPSNTTTYQLKAVGQNGKTVERSVTVTVVAQPDPVIQSFSANPSSITQGQSSTLSWDVKNAQTVILDANTVKAQGSTSVSPSTTTTYHLKAVGLNGKTVERSVTVTVVAQPDPVIQSFSANPSSITQGQSSTLSWDVKNAQTVVLDAKTVSAQGSTSVSPSTTTTYHLKAVGLNGKTVERSVTVTVVAQPDPVIQSFSANPSSITQGQSTTLRWDVKNAQTVTLGSNPVNAQGSTSVSPSSTTTYQLKAVGANGKTVERSVTVTVVAAPDPELQTGFPGHCWKCDKLDILEGDCVQLGWFAKNSVAVYLDGESVGVEASRQICPNTTTSYHFHVEGANGKTIDRTVTVNVTPRAHACITDARAPGQVALGQSFTVSWTLNCSVDRHNIGKWCGIGKCSEDVGQGTGPGNYSVSFTAPDFATTIYWDIVVWMNGQEIGRVGGTVDVK